MRTPQEAIDTLIRLGDTSGIIALAADLAKANPGSTVADCCEQLRRVRAVLEAAMQRREVGFNRDASAELEHLIGLGLVGAGEERAARKRIDEHGSRSHYRFLSNDARGEAACHD